MKQKPPVARLHQLLSYDPATGTFRWRDRVMKNGKHFVKQEGRIAGYKSKFGYVFIRVDDILIGAHIIAWAMINSEWPRLHIDHRNGNPSDNRAENIRLASVSQNMMNARLKASNTSGVKGVWFCRQTGRWAAECMAHGKKVWLGRFDTLAGAAAARARAARKSHGEFYQTGHRTIDRPARSQQPAETPLS